LHCVFVFLLELIYQIGDLVNHDPAHLFPIIISLQLVQLLNKRLFFIGNFVLGIRIDHMLSCR